MIRSMGRIRLLNLTSFAFKARFRCPDAVQAVRAEVASRRLDDLSAMKDKIAAARDIPGNAIVTDHGTYAIFTTKATWSDAQAQCVAKGGHLMTVTSDKELSAIKQLLNQAGVKQAWSGRSKSPSALHGLPENLLRK